MGLISFLIKSRLLITTDTFVEYTFKHSAPMGHIIPHSNIIPAIQKVTSRLSTFPDKATSLTRLMHSKPVTSLSCLPNSILHSSCIGLVYGVMICNSSDQNCNNAV